MASKVGRRRRLSGIGRITYFNNEDKSGSTVMAGIYFFEKKVESDAYAKALWDIAKKPENYRLRSKITQGGKYFEEIEGFNIGHLKNQMMTRKVARTDNDVKQAIAEFMKKDFDLNLPVWNILFLDENESGQQILVFRQLHTIGDGYAAYACWGYANENWEKYQKEFKEQFAYTQHWWFKLKIYLKLILLLIPSIIRTLVMLFYKEPDVMKKGLTGKAKISFLRSKSFDIPNIKKIGKKYSKMTVNEVFICLFAEAFSEYFGIEKLTWSRMSLPVNVRLNLDIKLSNCFGPNVVFVPLGKMSFKKRAKLVKIESIAMKNMPLHFYYYWGTKISTIIPKPILRWMYNFCSRYQSFQFSNVQIPKIKNVIPGIGEVVEYIPINPLCEGSFCSFIIASHAKGVPLHLIVDEGVVKDPDDILKIVKRRFDELVEEIKNE